MYFFRNFGVNTNATKRSFSIIYTGAFVFDNDVSYDLGRWSAETPRITKLYYDGWTERIDDEGEHALEPREDDVLGVFQCYYP